MLDVNLDFQRTGAPCPGEPIIRSMNHDPDRPLRIALLNSADHGGGAETIVRLLRDGLRDRGHQVDLWVGRRRGDEDLDHTRPLSDSPAPRVGTDRYARKGFFNLGIAASGRFCDSSALAEVDIIHLHNVHGHYFSLTDVRRLAERAPLVWTFHDFFPLTGGCAFPMDCEKWRSRCGDCPQLGRYPLVTPFDRTHRLHAIKRTQFQALPVTIVTPSEHLGRAAAESGMFPRGTVRIIPYAVDTETFQPGRAAARKQIGISPDRLVVLLVAQGLEDPRKGIDHAVAALQRIALENLTVLLAGAGDTTELVEALSMHDVRPLGYVTSRTPLAKAYAAADVLLFTSLAENFPCVVTETMASGTPAVAFDIDGVNEQIEHDRTGFLVPPGDAKALSSTLQRVLKDQAARQAAGSAARAHALRHWTIDRFLDRHQRLYKELASRAEGRLCHSVPLDVPDEAAASSEHEM